MHPSISKRSSSLPASYTCIRENHQHKRTAKDQDLQVHKIHSQDTFLGARGKQKSLESKAV